MGSGDSETLKRRNQWPLRTAIVGNLALFGICTGLTASHEIADFLKAASIPVFFGLLLPLILCEALTAQTKARLVFWKWKNPLPGSLAFSKYVAEDDRIDRRRLQEKHGRFPTSAQKQNALWYRLYSGVKGSPAVEDAHGRYLFTRDYATAALVLLLCLGIAGFWFLPNGEQARLCLALLALQYMIIRHIAELSGIRLVKTVMAIESTQ